MTSPKKSLGKKGEELAAAHLRMLQYKILERNYQCAAGEVDIIAKDHHTLVFVEVKTRSNRNYGPPAEAVDARKQRQLSKVALTYLKQKKLIDIPARFDVVAIEVLPCEHQIEVIRDAFELVVG
jgi:putative endonuclease